MAATLHRERLGDSVDLPSSVLYASHGTLYRCDGLSRLRVGERHVAIVCVDKAAFQYVPVSQDERDGDDDDVPFHVIFFSDGKKVETLLDPLPLSTGFAVALEGAQTRLLSTEHGQLWAFKFAGAAAADMFSKYVALVKSHIYRRRWLSGNGAVDVSVDEEGWRRLYREWPTVVQDLQIGHGPVTDAVAVGDTVEVRYAVHLARHDRTSSYSPAETLTTFSSSSSSAAMAAARGGDDGRGDIPTAAIGIGQRIASVGISQLGFKKRGKGVQFRVGQGTQMVGLERGICGMRPRGRRFLVVPPHMTDNAEAGTLWGPHVHGSTLLVEVVLMGSAPSDISKVPAASAQLYARPRTQETVPTASTFTMDTSDVRPSSSSSKKKKKAKKKKRKSSHHHRRRKLDDDAEEEEEDEGEDLGPVDEPPSPPRPAVAAAPVVVGEDEKRVRQEKTHQSSKKQRHQQEQRQQEQEPSLPAAREGERKETRRLSVSERMARLSHASGFKDMLPSAHPADSNSNSNSNSNNDDDNDDDDSHGAPVLDPQVRELLAHVDMAAFAPAFARERVSLADLPHLEDSDYEMLVPALGPRRRLQRFIAQNEARIAAAAKQKQQQQQQQQQQPAGAVASDVAPVLLQTIHANVETLLREVRHQGKARLGGGSGGSDDASSAAAAAAVAQNKKLQAEVKRLQQALTAREAEVGALLRRAQQQVQQQQDEGDAAKAVLSKAYTRLSHLFSDLFSELSFRGLDAAQQCEALTKHTAVLLRSIATGNDDADGDDEEEEEEEQEEKEEEEEEEPQPTQRKPAPLTPRVHVVIPPQSREVVGPCQSCDCDTFVAHKFKKAVCNVCWHKHEKTNK